MGGGVWMWELSDKSFHGSSHKLLNCSACRSLHIFCFSFGLFQTGWREATLRANIKQIKIIFLNSKLLKQAPKTKHRAENEHNSSSETEITGSFIALRPFNTCRKRPCCLEGSAHFSETLNQLLLHIWKLFALTFSLSFFFFCLHFSNKQLQAKIQTGSHQTQ